jgi:uncharacterized LabA/DUF88 family protein
MGKQPRTIVYIDGFNLYYRRLKGTPYRWLNLDVMCRLLLPDNQIDHINYYTARITDSDRFSRQDVYLRALATLPAVSITYGRYLQHTVQRPLANPSPGSPRYVDVIDNEEKGSDVNLATHLVLDGARNAFDVAVVISNDSDLQEPVRVVRREFGKIVGIISPQDGNLPINPQLKEHASFVKRIREWALKQSLFPEVMSDVGGVFYCPPKWKTDISSETVTAPQKPTSPSATKKKRKTTH